MNAHAANKNYLIIFNSVCAHIYIYIGFCICIYMHFARQIRDISAVFTPRCVIYPVVNGFFFFILPCSFHIREQRRDTESLLHVRRLSCFQKPCDFSERNISICSRVAIIPENYCYCYATTFSTVSRFADAVIRRNLQTPPCWKYPRLKMYRLWNY